MIGIILFLTVINTLVLLPLLLGVWRSGKEVESAEIQTEIKANHVDTQLIKIGDALETAIVDRTRIKAQVSELRSQVAAAHSQSQTQRDELDSMRLELTNTDTLARRLSTQFNIAMDNINETQASQDKDIAALKTLLNSPESN